MDIYAITNASGDTLDEYDVNQKLKDLGIPDDVIEKGETDIEDYAYYNNINLDNLQTKQNNKEIKGSNDKIKQDYQKELETLGIPTTVIQKGSEAVTAYADKKHISLPKQPTTGNSLNFQL